jgi:hypothetical protein
VATTVGAKTQPTSNPPSLAVKPAALADAQAVLIALDANPLDEKAQGKARDVIRKCKDSATIEAMYVCTGLLVTPITRMNCLNNGGCMPLPWSANAEPNGQPQWFSWQKYSDGKDIAAAALVRPWVTTSKIANQCGDQAQDNNHQPQQNKFALCMIRHMGGPQAQRALRCYNKNVASPALFSACLEDVTLRASQRVEIDCVMGVRAFDTTCATALQLPKPAIASCLAKSNGHLDQQAACLGALPRQLTAVGDCAKETGSDATLLAQCLKGAAMASPQVKAVQHCVDAATNVSQHPGTSVQAALLACAPGNATAKAIAATFQKSQALIHCVDSPNVGDPKVSATQKFQCLQNAGVKLPPQAQLVSCIAGASTALDAADCAGVKGVSQIKKLQQCLDEHKGDTGGQALCIGAQAGSQQAKLAACLAKAHTGLDAADCAGVKGASQIRQAQKCLDTADGDAGREALCIGAQAGLPPEQARLVACASNAQTYASGAACMIAPALGKQASMVLQCAADSNGSATGAAICMAGPSMNAELRIAAECVASSGGVPMTFAACAGGRLTMKEMQQCVAGGFRSDKGCFGPNNEIVKYLDAEEKILRGVLKAAGLETAYNNAISDLKSGKLGEGNDIRRAYEAINHISLEQPDVAARHIANEAAAAGQAIAGGVSKLGPLVKGARDAIAATITQNLPNVPATISVGPDHVGFRLGNSGVNVDSRHVGGSIGGKRFRLW